MIRFIGATIIPLIVVCVIYGYTDGVRTPPKPRRLSCGEVTVHLGSEWWLLDIFCVQVNDVSHIIKECRRIDDTIILNNLKTFRIYLTICLDFFTWSGIR